MGKAKDNTTASKRLVWVDWMKVIGMYFIILGHLFPDYHLFIYVFNVPLFFIISGFLSKKATESSLFWNKLWYNLIVPMLIITSTLLIYKFCISIVKGEPDFERFMYFPLQLILGMHSALGTCWFIYTLVILKIIYYYTPQKIIYQLLLITFFVLVAASLKYIGFIQSCGLINICVSYPFFIIGTWIKEHGVVLLRPLSISASVLVFAASVIIVYACGCLGKNVWMYVNGYGEDYMIFLIGGVAGTIAVYIMSRWIVNLDLPIVHTISNGMIIILGYHIEILSLMRNKVLHGIHDYDLLISIVVLLAFVPVITFSEKYLPLLLGKYRTNRK